MKGKGKIGAKAGKQKPSVKVAKRAKSASPSQSYNSSGKSSSIRVSRAGRDGRSELKEWPRVVKIATEALPAATSVANLAVELCKLKKESEKARFDHEKSQYEAKHQAATYKYEEQAQLDEAWAKVIARHERLLTPAGYIPEAWELLLKARDAATRPQSDMEYLLSHLGDENANLEVIEKNSRESLIPFQALCDSEKPEGKHVTIDGIKWRVFTGKDGAAERDFNLLFRRYWQRVGEDWQVWEKRPEDSSETIADPDAPSIRDVRWRPYSAEEIAKNAEVARDPDEWGRRGDALWSGWKETGVSRSDFRALAAFRHSEQRDKYKKGLVTAGFGKEASAAEKGANGALGGAHPK